MIFKLLILIIISVNLYANNILKKTYYIDSRIINLSVITSNTEDIHNLFNIQKNRHTKRVKAKELINLLERYGYSDYSFKSNYINFVFKSPIDTSKIKNSIKEYYYDYYDDIDITDISVHPRSYIERLPKNYVINIRKKDVLSKSATINIKTDENKKIFFNYIVTATLPVYISKKKIKKNIELSAINIRKKSIILDKFRAKPIQNIQDYSLQTKRHIGKDKILTIRNVETLSVIKKNSFVNVSLISDGIAITFTAKALRDGKVNDIIKVQKNDGKKFEVIVTGRNKAEMK